VGHKNERDIDDHITDDADLLLLIDFWFSCNIFLFAYFIVFLFSDWNINI